MTWPKPSGSLIRQSALVSDVSWKKWSSKREPWPQPDETPLTPGAKAAEAIGIICTLTFSVIGLKTWTNPILEKKFSLVIYSEHIKLLTRKKTTQDWTRDALQHSKLYVRFRQTIRVPFQQQHWEYSEFFRRYIRLALTPNELRWFHRNRNVSHRWF